MLPPGAPELCSDLALSVDVLSMLRLCPAPRLIRLPAPGPAGEAAVALRAHRTRDREDAARGRVGGEVHLVGIATGRAVDREPLPPLREGEGAGLSLDLDRATVAAEVAGRVAPAARI